MNILIHYLIFVLILLFILRNNEIGPAGAQALAAALTGNSTMTELGLSCVFKYVAIVLYE